MSEIAQLIIGIFSAPTIGLLYWAWGRPERAGRPSARIVTGAVILAYLAAALLPLLEGQRFFSALFVAYPLLYVTLFRRPLRALAGVLPRWLGLFAAAFFLHWFEELFVVLDDRGDIRAHFVFYAGFYLGYAFTVAFLYTRWKFSFAQVFAVGGLWGVLVEQNFAGPAMLFAGLKGEPGSLLSFFTFGSFIFIVYGLYLAGPYLLFREDLQTGRPVGWKQLILAYASIVIFPLAAWGIWAVGLQWTGLDPGSGVILTQ